MSTPLIYIPCMPVLFEVARPKPDPQFKIFSLEYNFLLGSYEGKDQVKKMETAHMVMQAFTPLFDRLGKSYKVVVEADVNNLFAQIFARVIGGLEKSLSTFKGDLAGKSIVYKRYEGESKIILTIQRVSSEES